MPSEAEPLRRYEPSGRVGRRLTWALPIYVTLGVLVGVLYQAFLDWNPWLLLDLFLPVLCGSVLGVLAIATLIFGQVRNRRVAWAIALALPLASLAAAHLFGLGLGRTDFPGLLAALQQRLTEGDPKPSGNGVIPPAALIVFWLGELALFLAVALALPISWWHKAVFCEESETFIPRRRIAVRFGTSPEGLHQTALSGGLTALAALRLRRHPENENEGELRFYLHDASASDSQYLTVQWYGKLEGPTGRKVVRDVIVLRRIEVDPKFVRSWLEVE